MSVSPLACWISREVFSPLIEKPSLSIATSMSSLSLYIGRFSFKSGRFRLCLETQYTGVPKPGFFSNLSEGKLIVAISPSEMKDFVLSFLPSERLLSINVSAKPMLSLIFVELADMTFRPSLIATGFVKRTTALPLRTLSMVPTWIPLWPVSWLDTMLG